MDINAANAQNGKDNPAFEPPLELDYRGLGPPPPIRGSQSPYPEITASPPPVPVPEETSAPKDRQQWSSGMDFLMSCIAMSVGLGNVWRFPFTVYENGGGAFLVPYLIVLMVIGKPLYYMEMALGQFASLGSVHVWEVAPVFKGIGYGQVLASAVVSTYYCSLMAITTFYLLASFSSELPWSTCDPSWTNCFDSSTGHPSNNFSSSIRHSSSELYFKYTVLNEVDADKGIFSGIGEPSWQLSLCLAATWLTVWCVTCCGVRSSGKAAYFLALFPYVVLLMLLVRGVTLPGAVDGILFFVRPDFKKLVDPKVWYAAVTQCFFSLGVGFGSIVMMSSYNPFHHNIYKDVLIVTSMDTFTSILAGCTIFSILGSLAHAAGQDVGSVVKGGSGLAFVSYPEAIAKFQAAPQVFALLFFLMLLSLGVGSSIALLGNITAIMSSLFPGAKTWLISLIACVSGALLGLVYVTPGGQYVLTLVDYYSGTFPIFVLVTAEIVVVSWIYGVDNLCRDLQLMIGHRPGFYWRITWGFVTPCSMLAILTYTIVTPEPLTYNGTPYPGAAYAAGWILTTLSLAQIPLWAVIYFVKNRQLSLKEICRTALVPSSMWHPSESDPLAVKNWETLRRQQRERGSREASGRLRDLLRAIFLPNSRTN